MTQSSSPADRLRQIRERARPWHVVTIRDRRGWPLDTFSVCPKCWPDYAERLGRFHSSESSPTRPEGAECHWCEGECEVPF